MGLFVRGQKWWWYRFQIRGKTYTGSTKTSDPVRAAEIERGLMEQAYGVERIELPACFPRFRKHTPCVGVIYFIKCEHTGRIKIGFSGKASYRLKGLQHYSPTKLIIAKSVRGTQQNERWLHRRFQATRLHGEWFAPSNELSRYIEEVGDFPVLDGTGRLIAPSEIQIPSEVVA